MRIHQHTMKIPSAEKWILLGSLPQVVHAVVALPVNTQITAGAVVRAALANTCRTVRTDDALTLSFARETLQVMWQESSDRQRRRWHTKYLTITQSQAFNHCYDLVVTRQSLVAIRVGLIQNVAAQQGRVDKVEEDLLPEALGWTLRRHVVDLTVAEVHPTHVLVVRNHGFRLQLEPASYSSHLLVLSTRTGVFWNFFSRHATSSMSPLR